VGGSILTTVVYPQHYSILACPGPPRPPSTATRGSSTPSSRENITSSGARLEKYSIHSAISDSVILRAESLKSRWSLILLLISRATLTPAISRPSLKKLAMDGKIYEVELEDGYQYNKAVQSTKI
jgi:hypothetical protein